METTTKIIDFEHHLYIPELMEWLKKRTDYPYFNMQEGLVYKKNAVLPINLKGFNSDELGIEEVTDTESLRFKIMDDAGIDVACLSTSGLIEELPKELSIEFSQKTNNEIARLVKKYPDRYVGTFCLPVLYIEDALKELDRCVNELGLSYWHTHSNYGDHYLYEPQFEPIFAKLNEYGIPFYLHPHNPSCDYLLDYGQALSSACFGFGVDAMNTSIRLIISGLFDRYPNVRMILGHMGEYYPYHIDRMDNRFGSFKPVDPYIKCEGSFKDYFTNKNVMMTTSGVFDPTTALCAIHSIGIDNILVGTDYPYENVRGSIEFIKQLPLGLSDKEKILHGNGEEYILKRNVK